MRGYNINEYLKTFDFSAEMFEKNCCERVNRENICQCVIVFSYGFDFIPHLLLMKQRYTHFNSF